jgi:hypothetical protein
VADTKDSKGFAALRFRAVGFGGRDVRWICATKESTAELISHVHVNIGPLNLMDSILESCMAHSWSSIQDSAPSGGTIYGLRSTSEAIAR